MPAWGVLLTLNGGQADQGLCARISGNVMYEWIDGVMQLLQPGNVMNIYLVVQGTSK